MWFLNLLIFSNIDGFFFIKDESVEINWTELIVNKTLLSSHRQYKQSFKLFAASSLVTGEEPTLCEAELTNSHI